ncbi:hypothetical protein F5Y15DRAFT_387964 [Xylariaceae sp. FL0016]|nr:hypothetical protein F5Y15DRAFT_387964 [Xylariaceae sp. FL0016]
MTSPVDPQTKVYCHTNGHSDDILDRIAVSELCRGWPVYRDASEWKNFRSLFCEDAFVWTTWSKRQTIDNFIQKSKDGKQRGDFIMHRECGIAVDLNPSTRRAIGKMKATITQRFRIGGDGVEPILFDVDCDCRFHFFCFQEPHSAAWKVKYVKLIYDKDKVVAVDGKNVPSFTKDALEKYPVGYRYLGAAQSLLGHEIDPFLPTVQGPESSSAHRLWLDMYEKMGQWLGGQEDIDLCSKALNGFANGSGLKSGHRNGKGYLVDHSGHNGYDH